VKAGGTVGEGCRGNGAGVVLALCNGEFVIFVVLFELMIRLLGKFVIFCEFVVG
jgi:hypothetical protein